MLADAYIVASAAVHTSDPNGVRDCGPVYWTGSGWSKTAFEAMTFSTRTAAEGAARQLVEPVGYGQPFPRPVEQRGSLFYPMAPSPEAKSI